MRKKIDENPPSVVYKDRFITGVGRVMKLGFFGEAIALNTDYKTLKIVKIKNRGKGLHKAVLSLRAKLEPKAFIIDHKIIGESQDELIFLTTTGELVWQKIALKASKVLQTKRLALSLNKSNNEKASRLAVCWKSRFIAVAAECKNHASRLFLLKITKLGRELEPKAELDLELAGHTKFTAMIFSGFSAGLLILTIFEEVFRACTFVFDFDSGRFYEMPGLRVKTKVQEPYAVSSVKGVLVTSGLNGRILKMRYYN